MKKLPISICILSWNNAKTLKNTLRSYKKNGLLQISNDICILFQEISDDDKNLAEKFGVKSIGLKENIGIGKGIKMLAENAKFETILFLENDWELIEDQEITYKRLESGSQLIQNGFNVVRYRSRKNPGNPLFSLKNRGNELNYYDDWHKCTAPHLLESLHWLDPAENFPDKISKNGEYFCTTSRWANWTNNPFLTGKDFLLNTILPFAGESIAFERNIAEWWTKQNFKIAQGEGLFMHNDLKKYPKKTIWTKVWNRMNNLLRS